MGEYICPSCGEQIDYKEKELEYNPNRKKILGTCSNGKVCGVVRMEITVEKDINDL